MGDALGAVCSQRSSRRALCTLIVFANRKAHWQRAGGRVPASATIRSCTDQRHQRFFSDVESVDQSLDFSGHQDSWRSASLRALTDEMDWIAVEQLISASVIEKHGHQISNCGATALRQRQPSKPRFNLYCSDLSQCVLLPVRTNPSVQICLVRFLCCVTPQSIVFREFSLFKVIAELPDRNRASTKPRLLRIDLCQQDSDSVTRSGFIRIAFKRTDDPLPLDASSMQILLRPSKLPNCGSFFAINYCQTSVLHRDPPAPRLAQKNLHLSEAWVNRQSQKCE